MFQAASLLAICDLDMCNISELDRFPSSLERGASPKDPKTRWFLISQGDFEDVKLLMSTERIGSFCSYLWIDNLSNPMDRKTVRVSMEVVCTHR